MTPVRIQSTAGHRVFCIAAAVCGLLGALVLCSPALASRPHEFSSIFGEPCIAEPCEEAQLKEPDGVAVGEAGGELYVTDRSANRLVRFDSAGTFQSEVTGPSATGTGTLTEGSSTIESALATTGAFSVGEEISAAGLPPETKITAVSAGTLEVSNPVEAGKSGVAVELTAQQRFQTPEAIAVDNSCVLRKLSEPQCKEEDPSNGDVYVVDVGHFVVDKFSATGEYLGQITEDTKGPFFHMLEGVAVDLNGGVWVYQEGQTITGYANTNANTTPTSRLEPSLPGFALPGIAVDAKGDFYPRYEPGRIAKVDPSGAVLVPALDGEQSNAVAIDLSSGNILIDDATSLRVLSPEATVLERLGQEHGEEHLSRGAGIGVSASAATIYVADAAKGEVVVFGPAQPTTPKVESESVANVNSSSASLGAQINPRSEEGEAATEYSFQYGRCETASSCSSSGYEEVPHSAGQLPADFEGHSVAARLEGLAPGTTYHFRAIAKNSHGQGEAGEERTFTTEGGGGELSLPDNRGYELVSPPDKQGSLIEPITEDGVIEAAASGDGITYVANAPTEAQPQGYTNNAQVLSSRAAASWSSRDIAIPHAGATGTSIGQGPEYKFFERELGAGVVQSFGPFNPALSEEASESTPYLRDLSSTCADHCYRPLVSAKAGFANVPEGTQFGEDALCEVKAGAAAQVFCGPEFRGASEDLSHIVLGARAVLTPGAAAGGLYEWSGGALSLVSILPGGEATESQGLGLRGGSAARRAISPDGSRLVWSTLTNLYTRDMALRETVELDEAEACAECTGSGGGRFQIASTDGSRVFFSDTNRLSEGSGADPGEREADLYECRIALAAGKLHCALSDLTPKHGEEGADVQGGILGASEDGSLLYFVARGVQSEAANARGEKAQAGKANLYVRRGASTEFIATLAGGDNHDWSERLEFQPTRVSSDGRFLELMSEAPLTGYDNRDRATGKPTAEVYLYDASSKRLSCASCEPSGVRPVGVEYRKLITGNGGLAGGIGVWTSAGLVAGNVVTWAAIGAGNQRYQPRYLADSGRLFFNSAGALVPQDANATEDVYEYEPPGVGGCSEALPTYSARSGGCVSLISSGRSAQESAFLDASESGDDVFFLTSAKLSPLDVDAARDVYDAHVCTSSLPCISFAGPEPPPCSNEASCKASPSPQPSIFGAPASATFEGPGNPSAAVLSASVVKKVTKKTAKCVRGKKRRHGRCVKTRVKKKTNHKRKG